MKTYLILYNSIKIGVLEINDKNQYKYTPNQIETQKIKNVLSIFPELLVQSEWREPIPLFKNRIDDAKRFNQNNIFNQTDQLKMILIE